MRETLKETLLIWHHYCNWWFREMTISKQFLWRVYGIFLHSNQFWTGDFKLMCTLANFVRVFLSTKLFWEFPDLQFNLIFLHRTKCSSTLFRSDVVNTTGAPFTNIPDIKVHGANMGLIWGRQDPGGPHGGPNNFTIWDRLTLILSWKIYCMPSSERDGAVEVWIFHHIWNSMENSFYSHPNSYAAFATKFCARHGGCDVVAWAWYGLYRSVIIRITEILIFFTMYLNCD